MRRQRFWCSVVFLLAGAALGAQENTPPPSETESEKKELDYTTLVQETLLQDIETANYYELVSWCRMLGLDDTGDRQTLIRRLKEHFKTEEPAAKKEILRKIEIKSARSSEYFTLDELEEDYVLIEGDVTLVLTDQGDSTQHTISAERILYNQATNTITANGNIRYTRAKGDKLEEFKGETFVFDASNWEGVLYLAEGTTKQEVEGETVVFRYYGETVTRRKDNSIVLEKGTITSSPNVENPNYRITASRIWVFGPGEWAIENAVLYIGYIPALYFPFYFYSSNELFFNPVIGYKLREGAYMQNTIYLIGKKEREEGVFSFLQLEETNDADYELELDGLFLRPVQKKTATSQAEGESPQGGPATQIKHLKLFADLYSKLGAFTGLSLDATPAFKLFGGLGLSRSIFYNTSYGYTSFYNNRDYWNTGNFFGQIIPFRFGLETEFDLSWGILQKITGKFYYFSDPFFPEDFYARDESQDWGQLIGFDLSTPTVDPNVTSSVQRTNLVWSLNLQLNLSSLFKTPVLQTVSINPFSFTFEWGSKNDDDLGDPIVNADPARMFYYPQRIIFPNMTLSVGGSLFQYTDSNATSSGPQGGQAQSGKGGLRLPQEGAGEEAPESAAPEEEGIKLIVPETQPDVVIDRVMKYFSTNANYSLSHTFKMEHLFDHENWLSHEDIDYRLKNSVFDHLGVSNLNYQLSFWNAMVEVLGGFSVSDKYRITNDPSLGFQQTETDKQATSLDLTNNLTVRYALFPTLPDLKNSRIAYSLRWDFYDIYYSTADLEYKERFLMFERETVGTQQLTADFIYQPEDKQHYLKFLATIPPVLGRLYSELNFYVWITQTTVTAEYKELSGGGWNFEPLRVTERLTWERYLLLSSTYRQDLENNRPLDVDGNANIFQYRYRERDRYLLSQEIKYDFTESTFTKSLTTLDLFDFKTTLLYQRMIPLTPLGFQDGAEQKFVPYKLGFSYYLNALDLYWWKNRIAFTTSVTTALDINFQKMVDSKFTLGLQFSLKIHEFLDINLKFNMYNNNVYRYIPAFVNEVNQDFIDQYAFDPGIQTVNPIEDLLKSFNFFNINDRYDSFFKLQSIGLELVHYLEDWVFRVSFTGLFQFQTLANGTQVYRWIPTFTFSLKWLPIPQIQRKVTGDESGVQL